jgi:hypothetical protein
MSDLPPIGLSDPFGIPPPERPLPKLSQPAEVEALPSGSYFLDAASGKRLQRPYDIPDISKVSTVPEGSYFRLPGDPKPKLRSPTEPLDAGAAALYGLASKPSQQRKVLEVIYGKDAIQEEPGTGELLVRSPEGKWLRPGKGAGGPLGWLEGAAAPGLAGIGTGALAAGTTALMTKNPMLAYGAGVAGGGVGMMEGRAFNNMILGLFGVTSSADEEREMLDEAMKSGMIGEAVGRPVGSVLGAGLNVGKEVVAGTTKLREAGPRFLRYATGTNPEELKQALKLREGNPAQGIPGVVPPVSMFAHEVPMFELISKEFDPMFRLSPMMLSQERFYEATAGRQAERFGIDHPGGSYLSPERAVDTEGTGVLLQSRVADELARKNAALDTALEAHVADLRTGAFGQQAEKESTLSILEAASADLRKTATETVDAAFAQLDKHAAAADKRMGGGPYPGEAEGAHKNVAERLHQVKGNSYNQVGLGIQGVSERGYRAAYTLAGQTPLYKTPLEQEAVDYLSRQAPGFEQEAPGIVQKFESISKLVGTGRIDPATGEEVMQVPDITLEQAHSLLKWANAKPNWNSLNADVVEGAKQHMAGMLRRWMHDPRQPPAVQAGVRELDRWNAWYKNAMAKFDQKSIMTISHEMDNNRIVNAPSLAKMIFEEGDKPSAYNLAQIKKLIGGQRFRDLLTIDMKRVVDGMKDSTGRVDGIRLANDVADRLRRGVWPETEAGRGLLKDAQQLALTQGKIELEALPGDTVGSLLTRAKQFKADIDVRVKEDPLKVLEGEMKTAQAGTASAKTDVLRESSAGPLGFLARGLPGEQSLAAGAAAKRIIDDPNLIVAAAERFKPDSPEFTAIRQNYIESVLQHGQISKIFNLSETAQNYLMPGISREEMVTFAKNWQALGRSLKGTFGGGMAATSRVTNPIAELRKYGGHYMAAALDKIPIVGPYIARVAVGKFYALITDHIITNQKIWSYMAKGLESSDKVEAEKARILMQGAASSAMRDVMKEVMGGLGVGVEALGQAQPAQSRRPQRPVTVRANTPMRPAQPGDQTLRSIQ